MPISTTGFVLTSNRDEAPGRNTLPPEWYEMTGRKLLFPKDEIAGGTWIGVSDKKRLICLLNGGFEPHQREENYRMSRGVIVTNLLKANNAVDKINEFNFRQIEPFTLIMVEWEVHTKVYELVWDGLKAHLNEKPLAPQIWSSSLLYNKKVKRKREKWFSKFLFDKGGSSPEELLDFHKTAGEGNIKTNLVMDRGFVKTKSISQFFLKDATTFFRYEDLQTGSITNMAFELHG